MSNNLTRLHYLHYFSFRLYLDDGKLVVLSVHNLIYYIIPFLLGVYKCIVLKTTLNFIVQLPVRFQFLNVHYNQVYYVINALIALLLTYNSLIIIISLDISYIV